MMHDSAPPVSPRQARMTWFRRSGRRVPVELRGSRFAPPGGVEEHHLLLRPVEPAPVGQQLRWLAQAYDEAIAELHLEPTDGVWRRFFCSDIHNQASALEGCPLSRRRSPRPPAAISWIEQPPAPPAKLALWACLLHDPAGGATAQLDDATLAWRHNGLTHLWTCGLTHPDPAPPADQTRGVFEHYTTLLRRRGLSLADHAVRTWVFVRDIDHHYAEMVAARRAFFAEHGLTPETHFIASTGIEGRGEHAGVRVMLDAYAVGGLRPEQVAFLRAPDHLSPTHVYGATFERGTAIAYADRKQIFISGTASIDPRGEVLHTGDVARQLDRTLENIDALLARAGATPADVNVLIAYVRDPADLSAVERHVRARCGNMPLMVVTAAVCRPTWLVEIECQAVVPENRTDLPAL